jgi:hypothetical protein
MKVDEKGRTALRSVGMGELEELLADARADVAAAERQRRRRLLQMGEEEATLVGLLVDLAERGVEVSAETNVNDIG